MTPRASSRSALSRLPRWVTVLGLVLVLGELACAALLAAGAYRGTGSHRGTAAHGPAQPVMLRVDGVPWPHPTCIALRPTACGPDIGYFTSTGVSATVRAARLPFIRTIRVQACQSVRLNATSDTHARITCSITVDGRVLSQVTAFTPSSDFTGHGDASCHSTIPDGGTDPAAARQTAVLRIGAVPNAACRQAPSGCSPEVDYISSAGDATNFSVAVPFIAEVPEPTDGTVTLTATGLGELVTCSITVNGRILSQVMARDTPGQETICRARIP